MYVSMCVRANTYVRIYASAYLYEHLRDFLKPF